jgi:hypothetical protein
MASVLKSPLKQVSLGPEIISACKESNPEINPTDGFEKIQIS